MLLSLEIVAGWIELVVTSEVTFSEDALEQHLTNDSVVTLPITNQSSVFAVTGGGQFLQYYRLVGHCQSWMECVCVCVFELQPENVCLVCLKSSFFRVFMHSLS